jgi:hypothetical protein
MKKFGIIKSKILSKLTESYSEGNKDNIKNIIKLIKDNKDFRELYLLYEDMETKYFSDKETAQFYVNELSNSLKGRINNVKSICEKIDSVIGDVETTHQDLYDTLDYLLQEDSLMNLEKKVRAKIDLVEHLTKKKEITETKKDGTIQNENLLFAVLANNFNVLYDKTLSESEKDILKKIVSMSDDELEIKTKELKESITLRIELLINESTEEEIKNKLNKVKDEVLNKDKSRISYYRLVELKNGLD